MESMMETIDSFGNTSLAHESRASHSKPDGIKQAISDNLRKAAKAVGDKAADPQMEDTATARYGRQVSSWLNASADYVSDINAEKVKSDLQHQIRQNPGRSLLIAGAVGLLLGSLLRRR
jgi:hypothetical protein